MRHIRLSAALPGPPEVAWELFTDHAGWASWAGAKEVVVRQDGEPAPDGLGAICVLRANGLAIEEEVTAFDAPHRLSYRLTAGLPTRDHSGEVRFEACEAGTRLVWSVQFRPLVPGTGWLVEWGLRRSLDAVLARFVRELEARRAA